MGSDLVQSVEQVSDTAIPTLGMSYGGRCAHSEGREQKQTADTGREALITVEKKQRQWDRARKA